jgi:transcriptional regulator with XRE-family HTH domain
MSPDVGVPGPRELGAAVRRARHARGFTIRRLARVSGMTESWLLRIEHGDGTPSMRKLGDLARTLGVPVSTILYDAEGRPFDDRIIIIIIDADELMQAREDPRVQKLLTDADAYGQRITREGRLRW